MQAFLWVRLMGIMMQALLWVRLMGIMMQALLWVRSGQPWMVFALGQIDGWIGGEKLCLGHQRRIIRVVIETGFPFSHPFSRSRYIGGQLVGQNMGAYFDRRGGRGQITGCNDRVIGLVEQYHIIINKYLVIIYE